MRQDAQVPVAVLQTGVAPVHWVLFPAEQTPHDPFGWQAGVDPLQSASAEQPRQFPVAALQTGDVPVHAVGLAAEHCPHAPDD